MTPVQMEDQGLRIRNLQQLLWRIQQWLRTMEVKLKTRSRSPSPSWAALKIKSLKEIYLFSLPIKESDY